MKTIEEKATAIKAYLRKKKVTQTEVAHFLGVSNATVSLALNSESMHDTCDAIIRAYKIKGCK